MQANSAELFEFAKLLLESAMHTFTVKDDGTIVTTATDQPVTLNAGGVTKQLALFTPQNQADKLVIIPFKDCFTADKARNWYYSAIREGLVQMVYGLLEQVIQHSIEGKTKLECVDLTNGLKQTPDTKLLDELHKLPADLFLQLKWNKSTKTYTAHSAILESIDRIKKDYAANKLRKSSWDSLQQLTKALLCLSVGESTPKSVVATNLSAPETEAMVTMFMDLYDRLSPRIQHYYELTIELTRMQELFPKLNDFIQASRFLTTVSATPETPAPASNYTPVFAPAMPQPSANTLQAVTPPTPVTAMLGGMPLPVQPQLAAQPAMVQQPTLGLQPVTSLLQQPTMPQPMQQFGALPPLPPMFQRPLFG